jgi:5-methylcytosine-specific restriction protein B
LLTKPFAILTGASGTGKTRLAESLAKHYTGGDESRYSVVAVGADWTDSRHVLGFVNHLRPVITAEGELPLYQSTPVLDLLLRADAAPKVPHFLVLDEMNLSHVERYFADFLSAMERPEGALELHCGGSDEDARLPRFTGDETGVPRRLAFPRNLFVIGTVNVDETTYMFSPKVLDRANVIEFRMSPQDLANFLSGDGSYPDVGKASASELQSFLALARERELETLPVMDGIQTHLSAIFSHMEKARFEFGYRAASEVIRYLKICRHLAEDKAAWDDIGWVADLDTQILQKLLPRLHGGMGRMGPLLTGLGHLCHGTQAPQNARLDSLASIEGEGLFPRSLRKIRSMANVLRDEQFVSFIC